MIFWTKLEMSCMKTWNFFWRKNTTVSNQPGCSGARESHRNALCAQVMRFKRRRWHQDQLRRMMMTLHDTWVISVGHHLQTPQPLLNAHIIKFSRWETLDQPSLSTHWMADIVEDVSIAPALELVVLPTTPEEQDPSTPLPGVALGHTGVYARFYS